MSFLNNIQSFWALHQHTVEDLQDPYRGEKAERRLIFWELITFYFSTQLQKKLLKSHRKVMSQVEFTFLEQMLVMSGSPKDVEAIPSRSQELHLTQILVLKVRAMDGGFSTVKLIS